MLTRIRLQLPATLGSGMSHQPDNILAGTPVVSLVEVGGTNNSLVRPLRRGGDRDSHTLRKARVLGRELTDDGSQHV